MSKYVTIYYMKRSVAGYKWILKSIEGLYETIHDILIRVRVRDSTDKGYLVYEPKLRDQQVGCKGPVEVYVLLYLGH